MSGRSGAGGIPGGSGVANAVQKVGEYVITMSQDKWWKLFFSIIIDFIGILSYIVPVLAEVLDVFWAPISALLIFQLYGNALLTGVAFIEEALPFTDITPTATIGWLIEYTKLGKWMGMQPLRPHPNVQRLD